MPPSVPMTRPKCAKQDQFFYFIFKKNLCLGIIHLYCWAKGRKEKRRRRRRRSTFVLLVCDEEPIADLRV